MNPTHPPHLTIQPIKAFRASVCPPGSKSLTNRGLILATLAEGQTTLRGVLFSDDTRVMLAGLKSLGVGLEIDQASRTVKVQGTGGQLKASPCRIDLGNSGTSMRFMTALLCLGQHEGITLDGIERMRHRPIDALVDALVALGGKISYEQDSLCPPLTIDGTGLRGGELRMDPAMSSQYITAVLQVGPYMSEALALRFDGDVISKPYIEMTAALMKRFGGEVEIADDFSQITVQPGVYRGIDYTVEPDASNASYFLAAAMVVPGSTCTIEHLGRSSLQGDVKFADVLHQMGATLLFGDDFVTVMSPKDGQRLRGIDICLNDMPDMAQTLAVIALFAQGQTVIRNIGNLRIKETDRLAAIECELSKLGAEVWVEGDDLYITPPGEGQITPAAIDTYDDHRMAMCFAVVGLGAGGITINDPGCVNKTFPEFFDYLNQLACFELN